MVHRCRSRRIQELQSTARYSGCEVITVGQTAVVAEVRIRLTRPEDLPRLREIEWASGQRFREYGLDQVAEDEPTSIEVLAGYANARRSWVAVLDDDPVGYVLVEDIDEAAHIEQISVLPDWQGQGVGRALIDQVRDWATGEKLGGLTLTTFGHIPWNRPLYEHLGFRVLSQQEVGSGLAALMAEEAAHGLDPHRRVAMRLDL